MNYSKQRSIILKIVRNNPVHPTAEWVYEQAKKELPSIGIATVYRNLNALVGLGEIDKISSSKEMDRFDGNMGEHYHFQCIKCGALTDLAPKDEESLNQIRDLVNTTFNIEDNNVRISKTLLKGVCNKCIDAEK